MRPAPYDEDAELAVLGYLLGYPHETAVVVDVLVAADFHVPAHRRLFSALVVDPDASVGELVAAGFKPDLLLAAQSVGAYPNQVLRKVRKVAGLSMRRSLQTAADTIHAKAVDLDDDDGAVYVAAHQALAAVSNPVIVGDPSPNLRDFVDGVDDGYDWVVPDMLERGDRLMVVAAEGGGKSTALRQWGVQFAAGIHPFGLAPIPPVRVLHVDLENKQRDVARKLRPLMLAARDRLDPDRYRVEVKPGGLDITQRADSLWLMERVAANEPDVVVIGPVYRMAAGDSAEEQQARATVGVLDRLRERFGVCLVMETHAPHGGAGYQRALRPFGSSLWLRWPEFGVSISPRFLTAENGDKVHDGVTYDLQHWRQPRDERHWPIALQRGGPWPWTSVMNESSLRRAA